MDAWFQGAFILLSPNPKCKSKNAGLWICQANTYEPPLSEKVKNLDFIKTSYTKVAKTHYKNESFHEIVRKNKEILASLAATP